PATPGGIVFPGGAAPRRGHPRARAAGLGNVVGQTDPQQHVCQRRPPELQPGLRAVEELKTLVPKGATLAQLALRWILEFPAVTCAIPGAKRPAQVEENLTASDLPSLSADAMKKIRAIYDAQVRPLVHPYW